MSQKQTTVAERQHFIDLKLQGYTLAAIAERTGWSFECVRSWWRRYRDGGRSALDPADARQQRGGRMSSFAPATRQAFTEIKQQHPGWGAAVARARIAEQRDVAPAQLPSVSTIEKFWAERCPQLLRAHRTQRAQPDPAPVPAISEPHERWQLDFKEWMHVDSVGYIDVLNIRDEATPVKIGSFVYPARQSTGRDVQCALRQAFTQWGLCDRLQTDRDKRLVNAQHDFPFPTVPVLWLAGLGVAHDLAPSAAHNGCVERFNGTWYERVLLGRDFASLDQIQATSDDELWWMNHKLPSQGRDCHGQAPLVAYPEAQTPRRPFSPQREAQLFSMQRVYQFLAQQFWWRHVSVNGQLSLGGYRYGIGTAYAEEDVRLHFDPAARVFVAQLSNEQIVKRFPPQNLSVAHITGRDLDAS